MKDNERLVSVSDYARQLGVSKQAIYNRINSGKLKAQRFERGNYHGFLVIVSDDEED
jgi:predicted DNA-binding protein YlxM (UPF0122 family)